MCRRVRPRSGGGPTAGSHRRWAAPWPAWPQAPDERPSASRAAQPGAVAAVLALPAATIKPLPQAIAELEARAIQEALAATGGNKVAAARLLGIARATLYGKLMRNP